MALALDATLITRDSDFQFNRSKAWPSANGQCRAQPK
jgi:hypothetical protein